MKVTAFAANRIAIHDSDYEVSLEMPTTFPARSFSYPSAHISLGIEERKRRTKDWIVEGRNLLLTRWSAKRTLYRIKLS